ncbi:MAG TPA: hypothetical protein VJ242_02765 [Patescibacteria group bacterium]|nr:hypothetical protein [Patescibacteria group bacterium]
MISKLYEERLRHDLARLAILSLITVVIWIGVAVYQALNKSQLTPDVKKQILPLTTSIELDTMESIKQRQTVQPADWTSLQPAQTVDVLLPPPEASAAATASPSAL